ncbi:MAG TPA: 5'-nucleotidase C-terminal domain-containing protein [Longimicrobiales bacterium]|nr:5'-nucleotidase C-terminal domain-containing protein [Longimicrobiales bacterium]
MKRYIAAAIPFLFLGVAGCAPPASEARVPAPAAERVTLTLLATTDVHGRILAHDYYAGEETDHGLSLLKPLIDSVRAARPGLVYLFDSGDLLQGNPFAYVAARVDSAGTRVRGNPIIHAMNLLDYDASAIGNHEFNYGLLHLDRADEQAEFPFLSANIFRAGTDDHAYRASTMLPHATAAGDTLLIGVTAATPPGVMVWDRENVTGELELRDITESLRPVVDELRRHGADLVVVLAHSGLEGTSYDTITTGLAPENESAAIAREVPGVDIVMVGHSHREVADTTINGVLLVQAKNWAASLAVVEAAFERTGPSDYRLVSRSGSILRPVRGRADAGFAAALGDAHERTIAYVESRVGTATAEMTSARARVEDTPLIDFINDVQRRAAGSQLSSSAAFTLDARIPRGPVTIADIAGVYVYDNTLKAIRITGAQLRAYLEKSAEFFTGWPLEPGQPATDPDIPGYNYDMVSGVEYAIDLTRPVGQRIVGLTFEGEPVRDEQTFTLALNNYRQTGGGGFAMLADAPVVYDEQREIRDLLIEEFERVGTVDPADYFESSWELRPAEAVERIQAELGRPRTGAGAGAGAGAGVRTGTRTRTGEAVGFAPAEQLGTHRLRVLALNDLHGRLLPEVYSWSDGRPVGGAVALASYFDAETRAFGGPTVLLDGGDVYQGTPISNLTSGRSTVDFYNAIGLDAAAVGNHEFDWGVPVLRERIDQARFPWLAANVLVQHTDTAPGWLEQVAVIDVDGVRLGVIGLATMETPSDVRFGIVEGLDFPRGEVAIDRWVPELRRRGADFVAVVAHAGAVCDRDGGNCEGEIIDIANAVRNRPDLIVAGHTHRVVRTRVNGIPIIETGSYGTRYGVVDLVRVSADSVAVFMHGTPSVYADALPPDTAVARIIDAYAVEIGPRVDRVVATLPTSLELSGGEYALGRIIADAQRWATHAQVAVMNNGGIRAALQAGPVTWGELYQVQPFENRLVRMQVRGADLRAYLAGELDESGEGVHVSGITVWFDSSNGEDASGIVSLELPGGAPLRDDDVYTVTMNDFMAYRGGAESIAERALDVEETPIVDLDALVGYLELLPEPIVIPTEDRIRQATAAPVTGFLHPPSGLRNPESGIRKSVPELAR